MLRPIGLTLRARPVQQRWLRDIFIEVASTPPVSGGEFRNSPTRPWLKSGASSGPLIGGYPNARTLSSGVLRQPGALVSGAGPARLPREYSRDRRCLSEGDRPVIRAARQEQRCKTFEVRKMADDQDVVCVNFQEIGHQGRIVVWVQTLDVDGARGAPDAFRKKMSCFFGTRPSAVLYQRNCNPE